MSKRSGGMAITMSEDEHTNYSDDDGEEDDLSLMSRELQEDAGRSGQMRTPF